MQTVAEKLAKFAGGMQFDIIPKEVVKKVKLHILDILGIGLAASGMEYARQITETIRSWGGHPESTVMRYGDNLPASSAVLANASFAHGLDYDDTHMESITHASACVIPTAFAVAEKFGHDGRALITAAVAGYEIITRIGLAAPGGFHRRGYHATPICGTFASGIVAGKLMGLTEEALANTLGICGSQAAGLQAFLDDGSWTKRFHAGWASHSGVIAAELAGRGFKAPKTVLEGRYGLYATHLGEREFEPGRIVQKMGEVWETSRIAFKPYPVCHFSHAAMDSAKALMTKFDLKPKDIVEGTALVPEKIVPIVCEPLSAKQMPTTVYGALFSLSYCIARMIVHGRAALEDFAEEALCDKDVLNVAKKIGYRIVEWPEFPRYFSGGLELKLRDGRVVKHSEAINRGNPDNPLDESDVTAKFTDNAITTLPRTDVERIIEAIDVLESLNSAADVMKLCVLR